jgi:hypothetical protein
MKLDLLTNAIVVDDAIRFVTEKSNDKHREQLNHLNSSFYLAGGLFRSQFIIL